MLTRIEPIRVEEEQQTQIVDFMSTYRDKIGVRITKAHAVRLLIAKGLETYKHEMKQNDPATNPS